MGKLDRFFSLLAIAAGLGIIITGIIEYNQNNHTKKAGLKATAIVIKVDTVVTARPQNRSDNSFRNRSLWGIYQYKSVDGRLHEVRAKTSGAQLGETTAIYYNPANPEQEYYLDNDYGVFLCSLVGGFVAILGTIFYWRASR